VQWTARSEQVDLLSLAAPNRARCTLFSFQGSVPK